MNGRLLLGIFCSIVALKVCGQEPNGPQPGASVGKLDQLQVPAFDSPGPMSDSIGELLRDSRGRIWCGTLGGGVSVYDPAADSWKTFSREQGLASDFVYALLEDASGHVWCGTLGGGASVYDPSADSWKTFSQEQGLASDFVYALLEDSSGRIWCGTNNGASVYDPSSDSWKTFSRELGFDDTVHALLEDDSGRIWCGGIGDEGGISVYDPTSQSWQVVRRFWDVRALLEDSSGRIWCGSGNDTGVIDPLTYVWKSTLSELGQEINEASVLFEDGSGRLWFGTRGQGVRMYDRSSDSWRTYLRGDGLAADDISALVEDGSGRIWCGTSHGVSIYDPASDSWQTLSQALRSPAGEVCVLLEDASGRIWCGSRGGEVTVYTPDSGMWEKKRDASTTAVIVDRDGAMLEDRAGRIWYGTFGDIATVYDPSSGSWQDYSGDLLTFSALLEDTSGQIWCSTLGKGLRRFNPSPVTRQGAAGGSGDPPTTSGEQPATSGSAPATQLQRFDPSSDAWQSVPVRGEVCALLEDRSGRIWCGTFRGPQLYDPSSNSFSKPSSDSWQDLWGPREQDRSSAHVHDLIEDSSGRIWCATHKGACVYDPASDTWRTFSQEHGLSSDDVCTMLEDASGRIWCGTRGGGASVYDPLSDSWQTLSQEHGLASDVVCDLIEDSAGRIWCATRGGVSVYDPDGTLGANVWTPRDLFERKNMRWVAPAFAFSRFDALALPNEDRLQFVRETVGRQLWAMERDRSGALWVSYDGDGLEWRRGDEIRRMTDQLPSRRVRTLAASASDPSAVWVSTANGVVLVAATDTGLEIVDRLEHPDLPVGFVDAIAAEQQQSGQDRVYLAYNSIVPAPYDAPGDALQRVRTNVWRVDPEGPAAKLQVIDSELERFGDGDIRSLAFGAEQGLWVGTSSGLFLAGRGIEDVRPYTADGKLPQQPVRKVLVAPDGTVFTSLDKQQDAPAQLVGFRPGTDWTYKGVPPGDEVYDFDLTDKGELVVMSNGIVRGPGIASPGGSAASSSPSSLDALRDTPLATSGGTLGEKSGSPRGDKSGQPLLWLGVLGVVFGVVVVSLIGITVARSRSLVARVRVQPALLRRLSLDAMDRVLGRLDRLGRLEDVWARLGLSQPRIEIVRSLVGKKGDRLTSLARLLGEPAGESQNYAEGFVLCKAAIHAPGIDAREICLVSFSEAVKRKDPSLVRTAISKALDEQGQPSNLPFILLDIQGNAQVEFLPEDRSFLLIGPAALHLLCFAQEPATLLAGVPADPKVAVIKSDHRPKRS